MDQNETIHVGAGSNPTAPPASQTPPPDQTTQTPVQSQGNDDLGLDFSTAITQQQANAPQPQQQEPQSQAQPQNDDLGLDFSTAVNAPEKPGFISRAYDTSGAKGIVDLSHQVVTRPIDLYHQAVEQAQRGDWRGATETASKIVFQGMVDKDNPIRKAAEAIIMQPVEQWKESYKENRAEGHNPVVSATNTPNVIEGSKELYHKVSEDVRKGNIAGAVGDTIGEIGGSHLAGMVPLVGGGIQQVSGYLDKDLHDHNPGAVAGDIDGVIATLGAGKVLGEMGKAGTAVANSGKAGNPLTAAADTVEGLTKRATTAPTGETIATHLQNMADTAVAPERQAVADNAVKANKAVDAVHQTATAEGNAKVAQAEYQGQLASRDIEHEANLAPDEQSIVTAARNAAEQSRNQMHEDYDAIGGKGGQLVQMTDGQTLPMEHSATRQAAQAARAEAAEDAGPVTKGVSKSVPASATVNKILDSLTGEGEAAPEPDRWVDADGVEHVDAPTMLDHSADTTNMADLLRAYRQINENMRSTGWATETAARDNQIYLQVKQGILQDINRLAEQSGNPHVQAMVDQMNNDYRASKRVFENPAVAKLLEGKLSDVDKMAASPQGWQQNITSLRQALGSHWDDFQRSSIRRFLKDRTKPDGAIDYQKALRDLSTPTMSQGARALLYGDNAEGILDALKKATSADEETKGISKSLEDADKVRDEARAGIGKTIQGKTNQINDMLAHLIGDGDIDKLMADPERRALAKKTFGPDGMARVGQMAIENKILRASTAMSNGVTTVHAFDPEKFLADVSKFTDKPEAVNDIFRPTPAAAAAYDKLMANVQNAARIKRLMQAGVLAPTLALGKIAPWAAIIAAVAEAKFAVAGKVIDALAKHPALWHAVGKVGRAADAIPASGKTVIGGVAKAAKVAGSPTARAIMLGSTSHSLGGKAASAPAGASGR